MTDSEKLDLILSEMQGMKGEMQDVKQTVQKLERRMSNVEESVTDMKLTLENEIRVNIIRVAEGHLDLSRNLHEALKIDTEKEMMAIRMNMLETEMRRIKEKLAHSA